jgi:cytidine deaminase
MVYTGINLDLACGIGFCAEHSAVAEMLKTRETVVRRIVAVNEERIIAPCGRCREMLLQVDARNLDCEVLLPDGAAATLRELLPSAWLEQYIVRKRG